MSIFIDLEMNTTDARLVHKKDLRNEVIEIGAVRMDDTFHPLDRFRIFVRPQYNGVIERKIYKLTGISNGAVSDAVSLPEALDALEAWCGSDGCEIYAWSTSDLCQLRKECGFKGIDSVFLDEMVQWHDFQEDFRQMLGEDSVIELTEPRCGSEDFSNYQRPGIQTGYFWLGGAYPGEAHPSTNHQPRYNWDERTMRTGVQAACAAVCSYLIAD